MHTTMFLTRTLALLAVLLTMPAVLISQPVSSKLQSVSDTTAARPLVTFVELGSVRCIPCKQMQPVMKAIEQKYREQVRVVFHDVWTDAGSPFAEKYRIKLIPTQVFLDAKGREFFRHEGFYPESEIHKLLQTRGLKILTKKR